MKERGVERLGRDSMAQISGGQIALRRNRPFVRLRAIASAAPGASRAEQEVTKKEVERK